MRGGAADLTSRPESTSYTRSGATPATAAKSLLPSRSRAICAYSLIGTRRSGRAGCASDQTVASPNGVNLPVLRS